MILFRTLLFILVLLPASWKRIAEKNSAIEEAERSFAETQYEEAVRQHLALIEEYQLTDAKISFNLALSYQHNGQEADAEKTYASLLNSSEKFIPSFSANQIGVLQGNEEKYQEALASFKLALIKNPENEYARYNYELLARWLDDREDDQEKEKSDEDDTMQPSNYAKRMKAEADELVDQFRFKEALDVMTKALEIDETVSYYEGFMNNLGEINEIDEN